MKNRKTLSTFMFTLLLSSCLLIKTDNTNKFTKKDFFYRMAGYGVINSASVLIAGALSYLITKNKKTEYFVFFSAFPIIQTTALEAFNNYGPDKTYIKKLGKKRFVSNIASIVGTLVGFMLFEDEDETSIATGEKIGIAMGGAMCGATSDMLLIKFFPPKKSPKDTNEE